jgi:hypothetical protein
MHFKRQDLEIADYNWDNNSLNDVFSGHPSRRLFDRYNGNQVLFLINSYALIYEKFTVQDGKRIEKELYHNLPLNAKSEISVFNWILKK